MNISQETIDEVARVGRMWPDGVHTCAELQKLEPGRRPCTYGGCPTMNEYGRWTTASDQPDFHLAVRQFFFTESAVTERIRAQENDQPMIVATVDQLAQLAKKCYELGHKDGAYDERQAGAREI